MNRPHCNVVTNWPPGEIEIDAYQEWAASGKKFCGEPMRYVSEEREVVSQAADRYYVRNPEYSGHWECPVHGKANV